MNIYNWQLLWATRLVIVLWNCSFQVHFISRLIIYLSFYYKDKIDAYKCKDFLYESRISYIFIIIKNK